MEHQTMIKRNLLAPLTILLSLSASSCVKEHPQRNSTVKVIPQTQARGILESDFNRNVEKIRSLVETGRQQLGRQNSFSYWGIEIKEDNSDENKAVFYFKKNLQNTGPEISIEFSDSTEMVSLYLNSMATARPSFTPSADGVIPAVKAFELLENKGRKERNQLLISLALELLNLGRFFTQPTEVKKYVGVDPENNACFVEATYDSSGNVIKMVAGYQDESKKFTRTIFLLGGFKLERDICSTIEYNESQDGFSTNWYQTVFGITFQKGLKFKDDYTGVATSYKGEIGAGVGIFTGGVCSGTKVTICNNRAQMTKMSFIGGIITMMPFLGATIRDNHSIDCRELRAVR